MAWLQVHQTLKDHRKLFDAADELEITPPHMMGLLVSFWLWALDNAPKGDLAGITPRNPPPDRLSPESQAYQCCRRIPAATV